MRPALRSALGGMNQSVLRCAALLVPRDQRADWRREWSAELWHMRRSSPPSERFGWNAERAAVAFCLGAFQDALCVRGIRRQEPELAPSQHGSAGECLFWLAGLLALSYILALVLPGVYVESHPSHYQINPGMILLQRDLFTDSSAATITGQQFLDLKASPQRGIDGLAFYLMTKETVSPGVQVTPKWKVAHASLNLFALLGERVIFSGARESHGNLRALVISDELWKPGIRWESEDRWPCSARRSKRRESCRCLAEGILAATRWSGCVAPSAGQRNQPKRGGICCGPYNALRPGRDVRRSPAYQCFRSRRSRRGFMGGLVRGAYARTVDNFQVRSFSRVSCIASHHVGVPGRILLQLSPAVVHQESQPLDFPEHEDCTAPIDYLFCIARFLVLECDRLFGSFGICSTRLVLLHLPLWHALDFARSARALSRSASGA
jgi:hypothetical protein